MKERQEKLFEELDLSGLESWPPELVASAWSLLAKCHDVFSLEPSKLGCTHSTKHVIQVTNDTLFKEQFRWIYPPLVEEVYKHLWEMLDSGVNLPSQSAWCNAVVLVRKKDSGLHFCIDFWHLNAHMKKDSYWLPRIQEAFESLVGAGHFSCLDLKSRFWQPRVFQVWLHALWALQCSHISIVDAKLPRGAESDILPHLPWWHSCLLTYCWRASPLPMCSFQLI